MYRISRLGLALSAVLWMHAGMAAAQQTAQDNNPAATAPPPEQQAAPPAPPAPPPADSQPADASSTSTDRKSVVHLPPAAQRDGSSTAGPKHEQPAAVAAQGADATPKEQAAAAAEVTNPAAPSGFRLMTLSTNALLSRVSLADQAQHTIDLQYFIFNNDATGRLIALHLLQAAERGVHVRMLLDDFNMGDDARMFQALAANPNIEVRLFNPFHSASPGPLSKAAQMLTQFERLNHRMHNKDYIVDNQVAIIGGRNIGDEYFDAKNDNNFRDLDVIAIGPVVPAATATFEKYWNSDASHPIAEFKTSPESKTPARGAAVQPDKRPSTTFPAQALSSTDPVEERGILVKNARAFEQSAYQAAAADDLPNGASADRPGNWFWGPANLVADEPEKIDAGADRADLRITPQLKGMIKQAQSEVLVISPYFIPSQNDDANFVALAQRGVSFKVLTNSMASTDELAVYGSYAGHRETLLKGGVQLYELKPMPGVQMAATDAGRSSGVTLHAKSIVVDHRYVFIGSLNMDPRSKVLNTEMGVVVDSPPLAKAVDAFFQAATLPGNAYHVVLGTAGGPHPSSLHWEYSKDGKDVDSDREPDAPLHRRIEVQALKLLPIDGML